MSDAGASSLGRTHLAVALVRPENRIAAGVTLIVALSVIGVSRLPLVTDVTLDLREELTWSASQHATLLGFSDPSDEGRTLTDVPARVIFNRPLPDSFELEIGVLARDGPARVLVEVGGSRYELRVGPESASRTLQVENPGGAREITVAARSAHEGELVLQRFSVRMP